MGNHTKVLMFVFVRLFVYACTYVHVYVCMFV